MTAVYLCSLNCDFCEGEEYNSLLAGEAGVKTDQLREQATAIGWTRVEVNGLRYDRCRECTEAGSIAVAAATHSA